MTTRKNRKNRKTRKNKTADFWRGLVAARCGGREFDAPGGGYSFSAVLKRERKLAKANRRGKPRSALLCLSVADPVLKMHPMAMIMAQEFYEQCPDATRYADNAGVREGNGTKLGDTHEEIVAHLKRRNPGLRIGPDWVQYSPGAIKRALSQYIPRAFFQGDGCCLVFPNPSYGVIKSPINTDIQVIDIQLKPENNWRLSLGRIENETRLMRARGCRVFVYFNNPHNPTGVAYAQIELQALVNWAIEKGIVLIVDEAYVDLRYGKYVSILQCKGWEKAAIVLQSISKRWNATGARFGWMVGHPTAIAALRKVTDVTDSGMFGPTIAAGLWCLRHYEIAEQTRQRYRLLHERLASALLHAGFTDARMPAAGLCQLVRAPKAAGRVKFASAAECAQWMREKLRVSVMHQDIAAGAFLRWAVTIQPVPECGLPDDMAVINEAARRIRTAGFRW